MSEPSNPVSSSGKHEDPRIKRFPEDERIKRPPEDARLKRVPVDEKVERAPGFIRTLFHPRDLGALFVTRRLVGEDETAYDELLSKITTALWPEDVIEAIWVKEFVDCIWDALLYQRTKVGFITEAQKNAVQSLVKLQDRTIAQWLAGDKSATAAVEKALKSQGYDRDALLARALSGKLDKLEQLGRMIENVERRRDKALKSLERRRENFPRRRGPTIEGSTEPNW
ncbi:hypothetical protein AA309_28000 [Microvirga vignae]|uniref:Uncharacterized protein n=1 Tax=Microvirga vignae TaxID=1225564 RepID=A0A0H1R5G0_9HYPH|nr:hypothetical protein [Microvirga vignae]KLK90066.1 hypothetical protein AA309_28000 [Microvirga vignae]